MSSKSLIQKAVRNTRWISGKALKDRLFIWLFNHLVYPQIWEDPEPDMDALELDSNSKLLTISSGGCNVLNYLCREPESITAVDLNDTHLALLKLKICAIKNLPDHESFFQFFGNANLPENRFLYEKYLQPNLDRLSRNYWESRHTPMGRKRYLYFTSGFYKQGLLGRFIGANLWVTQRFGIETTQILSAQSLEEQATIFDKKIAPFFRKKLVQFLSNRTVVMYPLGIPAAQFQHLQGISNGQIHEIMLQRIRNMACNFPISENYFAWQAFKREYDWEKRKAIPAYLKKENFEILRKNVEKISIMHCSLTDYLEQVPKESLNSFVFLDALDWMNSTQLENLWRQVDRTSTPEAKVVFRTTSGYSPLDVQLSEEMLKEWQTCPKTNLSFLAKDRSAVYGGFHLYEKVSLRTSSSETYSLVETKAPRDMETVALGK